MAKKKTTLGKVGAAIADATVTVIQAADAHVVHPVGEALGLMDGKKPAGKKPAPKKPAAKKPAAVKSAVKPPAVEAPKVSATKSSKQKMMGSVASNAMPKATGKKDPPKKATKQKS